MIINVSKKITKKEIPPTDGFTFGFHLIWVWLLIERVPKVCENLSKMLLISIEKTKDVPMLITTNKELYFSGKIKVKTDFQIYQKACLINLYLIIMDFLYSNWYLGLHRSIAHNLPILYYKRPCICKKKWYYLLV